MTVQNKNLSVLQKNKGGEDMEREILTLEQIKKDLNKNVKVNAVRKKPYFQDT